MISLPSLVSPIPPFQQLKASPQEEPGKDATKISVSGDNGSCRGSGSGMGWLLVPGVAQGREAGGSPGLVSVRGWCPRQGVLGLRVSGTGGCSLDVSPGRLLSASQGHAGAEENKNLI